jgi:mono/diheme cytochrome c family protein
MRFVVVTTLLIAAIVAIVAVPALAAKVTVDVRGLPKPAPAPTLDEATKARASSVFAARCALCHGMNGDGDGPSSATLNPKPRRFSDALWQASVTDEQIKQVILMGGGARKLSTLMIPSPDLKDKPELDALVAFIRSRRAPEGTARLVFGAPGAPPTRSATADVVNGVVRFDLLDVPAGTHSITVHGANGEHCKASAVVAATDVVVPCEKKSAGP